MRVAATRQIRHARRTQIRFSAQAARQARQTMQHAARIIAIRVVRCVAVAAHQTPLVLTIRARRRAAAPLHRVQATRPAAARQAAAMVAAAVAAAVAATAVGLAADADN